MDRYEAMRRGLARARRLLDANRGQEHDHRGPSPCKACGGTPLDKAVQHFRRPKLILIEGDKEEDTE